MQVFQSDLLWVHYRNCIQLQTSVKKDLSKCIYVHFKILHFVEIIFLIATLNTF